MSSTSSGPAVRGLPGGVRECMPMAQTTTIRPNRHPEATKPHLPPLGGGRCGWGGLLAVLTAILACGYTLVGSYVDSVAQTNSQSPIPNPNPQSQSNQTING